jgi:sugar fermentation stimulation protein A
LVRRYKRFLADVECADGRVITVHCPNPGSMKGTDAPGSAVRCSTSDNPQRKLPQTLEMIRVGRIWVGLYAARANQLARLALERGAVPGLAGYQTVRSEVAAGEGSRLDFLLSERPGDGRKAWVEVKSVTLAERGTARFPDAVTARGRRHLETLMRLRGEGHRAALLYCVQRADCDAVAPADDIDPEYGETLRRAAAAGVELFAIGCRVRGDGIRLEKSLPVLL